MPTGISSISSSPISCISPVSAVPSIIISLLAIAFSFLMPVLAAVVAIAVEFLVIIIIIAIIAALISLGTSLSVSAVLISSLIASLASLLPIEGFRVVILILQAGFLVDEARGHVFVVGELACLPHCGNNHLIHGWKASRKDEGFVNVLDFVVWVA